MKRPTCGDCGMKESSEARLKVYIRAADGTPHRLCLGCVAIRRWRGQVLVRS